MNNKIPYIITASTIVMLLLVLIQVKWMQQSRKLIEDQFDQKVSMALCKAVDEVSLTESSQEIKIACQVSSSFDPFCCSTQLTTYLADDNVRDVVEDALNYYNIDMPFVLEVSNVQKNICMTEDESPVYSCSLAPLIKSDNHKLNINFPGKREYVLKEMGLMLASSIIILLLIFGVFIYANYYLIKQKRLGERNKDFFNHMAHEFKTPLTNIGLAAKMLSKKSEDKLVDIINNENRQLTEQVSRVLTMASLDTADFEINKQRINLGNFVNDVLKNMEIQLQDKNVTVHVEELDEHTYILADKHHLCNAFRNILDNAIKYNDRIPEINIQFREINNKIHILIQDNGLGIHKKDQELVFKKFFRIKNGDTYNNKGFGLGLSYVKRIIELHKGEVSIFSELNRGTRFDLSLPKLSN